MVKKTEAQKTKEKFLKAFKIINEDDVFDAIALSASNESIIIGRYGKAIASIVREISLKISTDYVTPREACLIVGLDYMVFEKLLVEDALVNKAIERAKVNQKSSFVKSLLEGKNKSSVELMYGRMFPNEGKKDKEDPFDLLIKEIQDNE